VENGLGRTEQQILALVAAGEPRPGRLFAENQQREPAPFMGDWSFWHRIATLCSAPQPLLECTPAPFRFPPRHPPDQAFRNQRLTVTAAGERVLAGRSDWLSLYRLDTWLGGVHMGEGTHLWRWNRATGSIEASG